MQLTALDQILPKPRPQTGCVRHGTSQSEGTSRQLLDMSLQQTCPPLELDAGEGLRDSSLLTQPSRDGVLMELNSAGVSKPTHILTTNCLLGA